MKGKANMEPKYKAGDSVQLIHAPTIYGTVLESQVLACYGGTQIIYSCRFYSQAGYGPNEVMHQKSYGVGILEFELEPKQEPVQQPD